MCVCVCVCVLEKERERERLRVGRGGGGGEGLKKHIRFERSPILVLVQQPVVEVRVASHSSPQNCLGDPGSIQRLGQ